MTWFLWQRISRGTELFCDAEIDCSPAGTISAMAQIGSAPVEQKISAQPPTAGFCALVATRASSKVLKHEANAAAAAALERLVILPNDGSFGNNPYRRLRRTAAGKFRAGGPRADQEAVRPWNSAPAAVSPAPAAAATTPPSAAPAATPATATATTATANPGDLLRGGAVLPVEQMERGETDVAHLLFAENGLVPRPGQVVVGLRDVRGRQRRSEGAPHQ